MASVKNKQVFKNKMIYISEIIFLSLPLLVENFSDEVPSKD